MGFLQASEMAQSGVSLDVQLSWHLQSNHYPPIPLSMVPACKRAIAKANRGEWAANVNLPPGVSYRGQRKAPVSAIVEQHHLDAFINPEEE